MHNLIPHSRLLFSDKMTSNFLLVLSHFPFFILKLYKSFYQKMDEISSIDDISDQQTEVSEERIEPFVRLT